MKIRIAFAPEDRMEAAAAMAALLRLFPDARLKERDAHPPFKHLYMTTKRPGKC